MARAIKINAYVLAIKRERGTNAKCEDIRIEVLFFQEDFLFRL